MKKSGTSKSLEIIFGRKLGYFRRRLGISQEELGFRAGLHRTYISQIERGLKSPTLTIVFKLSKTLGLTPSRLLAAVEKDLLKR